MKNKKKFVQVFALALIMLLIASSTYAYFAAQIGDASNTDITVTTSTVDNLTFETGDAISLYATQSNFSEGSGNQSDDTYASATLVANNDTNSASANYYLYIKIDTNGFEYTTSDKTAELILTITDPDGNEVTSLSGLNYTSVVDGDGNTVSGFDITSKIGLITIASDYLIESTGVNTQEWNIEVTLVNLSSDQSDNAGKSFSASLVIQGTVYGNTLMARSTEENTGSSYSYRDDKIWEYRNSITKIVFDDSGSTISDYEEVYDITNDDYCYYDGNEVYNFDGSGISESSCNTVYKVTDDDYTGYFDDSFTSYMTEYGNAVWDSEENVCKTSDGNEVYTLVYGNSPTEEQCSGTVYYDSDYDMYYVGIKYVGSGEWDVDNYSSIQAYLVNNGDSTYTVYIESDAPILANENMSLWFYGFTSLESIEGLDELITSNVTNMSRMFYECISLTSLDLSSFDTSNVKYMGYMFESSSSLTILDLTSFDTSNVTDMSLMFYGCSSLTSLDLSNFDTSNVTDMLWMFSGCSSLTSLDLSNFDTSNVTTMSSMFNYCLSLTTLDLSSFDTSSVTTMHFMFYNCSSLTSLDLSNFDTSSVIYMDYMFYNCSSLTSLDLSSFVTSNVEIMSWMFYGCGFTSLDLSSFDTSSVENMYNMFSNCSSLTALDLSNADFSNVTSYSQMFYENNSSITVTVKDSSAYDFITARLSEYNGGTVLIA